MSRMTIDEPLSTELGGLTTPVELYDASGRMIGHFVPAVSAQVVPHPSDECPYSIEELARMQQETGGRSLAEIWKSLGRT